MRCPALEKILIMLERDDIYFFDISGLERTEGIKKRADSGFLRQELEKLFPGDDFTDIKVTENDIGFYKAHVSMLEKLFGGGRPVIGLPEYYEIELIHRTGDFCETIIVWSPVLWNDRFAGTAGGGISTGGRNYLTRPNNTQRGWTVPFAVMNGFTAATAYAGNIESWNDYTTDESGKLRGELYENWRLRTTHNMTVFGKAIAEILHQRPVKYSYLNGGSGGGRQSLMEVQNYPHDYDGVWASCPAINWHYFLISGFWPIAVMNEHNHYLSSAKNRFFLEEIHKLNGGRDAYYDLPVIPEFDSKTLIGRKVGLFEITEKDSLVMNEILKGPHREDGTKLWYSFRPGVQNWQKVIPIGTYYYPLFSKKIKPFILGPIYLTWITGDKNYRYKDMGYKEFVLLFDLGAEKFADSLGDSVEIDAFASHGGKVIIDHGTDDPLIPVDGTLDYYRKLVEHFGSSGSLDSFLRLYITPGDNHGNCWGNNAGITEKAGMTALIDWVEKGISPEGVRKVRVNRKKGELITEGIQFPYRSEYRND